MSRNPHRIVTRRKRLGLSQAEIGELAGFPVTPGLQATVSQVELGYDHNPDRIRAIRRALIWEETKPRREREERRRHDQRIERQAAIFAAVPPSIELARLKAAMLERCLDLLNEGRAEEFDAIADWLPASELMTAIERDQATPPADRGCLGCQPAPFNVPGA